jgi:hypothetical protein
MSTLMEKLSPSATDMIRADHTRVLGMFHQYEVNAKPQVRQAIVNSVCLALEIHAQIEEEIFYPAMRLIDPATVEKNVPEHEEMRRLIAELRGADPESAQYDRAFMELMRNVMHHVAEEETILLVHADRVLGERLGELGAQMTRRRLELSLPHAGEMAMNTARTMSTNAMLVGAGALVAGMYLFRHAMRRRI